MANSNSHIHILKEGKIGYFPYFKNTSKINKTAIDEIVVEQGNAPSLVSLEFLAENLVRNYEVKSIGYSVMFQINIRELK